MTSRLARLIGIEKTIRTGSFPGVSDLCDMFEIQPRTLFQDIKELRQKLGCQIKFSRIRQGYYSDNPQHQLPSLSLTDEELFVLIMAAELLAQVSSSSITNTIQEAITKIVTKSGLSIQQDLDSIKSVVHVTAPSLQEVSLSKLHSLYSACINSRLITIRTDSDQSGNEEEIIEPHYLLNATSRWFLVGFSRKTLRWRYQEIDAIVGYEITELPFEKRSDQVPF